MALALDSTLKRHAMPLSVAHPVLKHKGGGRGIADRAAVGTTIRKRIYAVIRVQRLLEKIEIALGIVQ